MQSLARLQGLYGQRRTECGEAHPQRTIQRYVNRTYTEFSSPSRNKFTKDNVRRTWVFFCDPMSPNQKSQLERNHELVREILSKGVSFDALTQEQTYLALSHVNSYVRYAQGNRTPFEVFEFLYGEGTAAKLHIDRDDERKDGESRGEFFRARRGRRRLSSPR